MSTAWSTSRWPRSRRISAHDWPVDVLHDDEVLVRRLVEARVEHLHDVGVHEPRRGQRLAPEPRDERRVVGQVLGQQLHGDVALEALVEASSTVDMPPTPIRPSTR